MAVGFCFELAGKFDDAKGVGGFEIPFAAKPVFHRNSQGFERDTETGFKEAVAYWQGVVKNGVIGEVSHGEVVDPMNGTWAPESRCVDRFDLQFAQKHRVYY